MILEFLLWLFVARPERKRVLAGLTWTRAGIVEALLLTDPLAIASQPDAYEVYQRVAGGLSAQSHSSPTHLRQNLRRELVGATGMESLVTRSGLRRSAAVLYRMEQKSLRPPAQ